MRDAVLCGVKVMIYTINKSEADEARRVETAMTVELLKEAHVDVVLRKELAQRYAVIDGSIVWYGSVDLLAFGRKLIDSASTKSGTDGAYWRLLKKRNW